ncbi:MAG TPA: protein kinase [Bryobacteraceae bacterium]|nr:protein kinase [Bryobacteraceae bacterium]
MAPWVEGTELGPYVLIASIGAGGMGEVWKARDTRLDRIVAVKRLHGRHSARFEQEGRAIAALNHPNICTLHDVGPDYLVMEYVEGKPLRGPMPAADAVRLAIQIAAALEEAHGKRILHRDLKPGNILVTARGAVKLLDFGLAKLMADADSDVTKTMDGSLAGTLAYMAPEQAEGKSLDERSDIFSLGAVLYEMLSGQRAFRGESTLDVLNAVVRGEPAPLETSSDLARIVMRCLRKAPADRFQSAAELKLALEQCAARPAVSKQAQPSIAVLPFANMSADKDQEYFSDGLAEEIINVLAHIPGLKVIARTSAFAFRGKEQDIRKIAETLGVATILEGSVRRAGNRIRVTAQLIDAEDGAHLWSERYDREMADVFELQDEIAAAIAEALKMKLSAKPSQRQLYTPKLPAYEALLRARHHLNRLNPQSMDHAQACFERAIALDQGYALPHVELGLLFVMRASFSLTPAHEAMPRARAAVRQALAIDPSLPEALAALGWITGLYDYDWKEAGRLFSLAMARDPIPPSVHQLYAFHLLAAGQPLKALEEMAPALREDPLNSFFRTQMGQCLLLAGRYADAVKEAHRVRELDESYFTGYFLPGMIYTQQGNLEEAVHAVEKAHDLAPWAMPVIGTLAGLLRRTGNTGRSAMILQKLGNGTAYDASRGFVFYHLVCSEIDQAADWAEKAIEQRSPTMPWFLRLPIAKELRSSPRWPKLAKMMNLPDVK